MDVECGQKGVKVIGHTLIPRRPSPCPQEIQKTPINDLEDLIRGPILRTPTPSRTLVGTGASCFPGRNSLPERRPSNAYDGLLTDARQESLYPRWR